MSIADILAQVRQFRTPYVTVTGGEPLSQANCLPLLEQLCDAGYRVSLETSGAVSVAEVDPRVMKVMDIKTPGSGEMTRNRKDNLRYLAPQDQVKFVLCDRSDYDWACDQLAQHRLPDRCDVLFSPSYGQLDAARLADWILQDQMPVRMQLQLHKILWGDQPGR